MRLSIITVNYNNPEGLERTINSVEAQTCMDFEYVVVDGASTSGDVDVIKRHQSVISKWVSEPDKGIYNAMNKGVGMASGDYCLFLNSGDTLYCEHTIEEIYAVEFKDDFIEGRIKYGKRFSTPPAKYTLGNYMWKRNNFHQGCLIKRVLLLKYPYNEEYRIAADMRFNIEVLIVHNCSYHPIDVVISDYEQGGLSTQIEHGEEIESIFRDFFPPRVIEDYEDYYYLYDFPAKFLMPLVRRVGHSYWLYRLKIEFKKITGRKIRSREYLELEKRR